jgi:hypothetical protein
MTDLAAARAQLDRERRRLAAARVAYVRPPPGVDWRPTPTPYEANLRATTGTVPLTKVWDRSPIDPQSFDPTQPPLPGPPPANTTLPSIVVVSGSLSPGGQLGVTVGSWSGDSLVYARQWDRNGAPIPGEINPGYLILDTDVGAMLGCTVIASHPNGTASADAAQVGPIEAARVRRRP